MHNGCVGKSFGYLQAGVQVAAAPALAKFLGERCRYRLHHLLPIRAALLVRYRLANSLSDLPVETCSFKV